MKLVQSDTSNRSTGNHVVQRLITVGKSYPDISDSQSGAGDEFGEMPSCSCPNESLLPARSVTFKETAILPSVAWREELNITAS